MLILRVVHRKTIHSEGRLSVALDLRASNRKVNRWFAVTLEYAVRRSAPTRNADVPVHIFRERRSEIGGYGGDGQARGPAPTAQ